MKEELSSAMGAPRSGTESCDLGQGDNCCSLGPEQSPCLPQWGPSLGELSAVDMRTRKSWFQTLSVNTNVLGNPDVFKSELPVPHSETCTPTVFRY